MNAFFIKTIMILGLNKVALKISATIGLVVAFISSFIDKIPKVIFGVTIFLWMIYVITIMLDWRTGILASKKLAKDKEEDWKFDKDKANANWYKHALFIIIMATIYHFNAESIRNGMAEWIGNTLMGLQYAYFAYNMLTEWASIENNRAVIKGKMSRLGGLITSILNIADEAAKDKAKKLTGVKNENLE